MRGPPRTPGGPDTIYNRRLDRGWRTYTGPITGDTDGLELHDVRVHLGVMCLPV